MNQKIYIAGQEGMVGQAIYKLFKKKITMLFIAQE